MQDFPLQALYHAVSARRTQLRVVQVKLRVLPDSASLMQQPMADILTAFRELAADGMQIYIGAEGRNIISN
jgi:predicted nuclease with RNAse H fold